MVNKAVLINQLDFGMEFCDLIVCKGHEDNNKSAGRVVKMIIDNQNIAYNLLTLKLAQ